MQSASTNGDKGTNTLASGQRGLPTDPLQSQLDFFATALTDHHQQQQQQQPPRTNNNNGSGNNNSNNNNSGLDWLNSNDSLSLSHPSDLLVDSSAPLNVPEPDQFDDDLERVLAGIEPSQLNYINTYQPTLEEQFLLGGGGSAAHDNTANSQGAGGILGTAAQLGSNSNAFNTNATAFGTNAFGTSGAFGPLFGYGSFTHYGGYGGPGSVVTVSSESAYGGGIADDAQSESYYNPYSPQGSLVNAANPSHFNSNLFQALENFSNELAAFGLSDTNINPNTAITNNNNTGGSISGLEGIVPSQTRLSISGASNTGSLAAAAAAANPNPTTIQPPLLSLDLLMPSSTASGHSFTSSFDDTMSNNNQRHDGANTDDAAELEREFGTSTGLVINGFVPVPPQSAVDPRKKYQCPSCPRAFARAFNLKTHMATHDPNRLKPHICHHPNCGRSFSRKHDLGRHLVSIHKDESGLKLTRADGEDDGHAVGGSGGRSGGGIRSGSSTYGVPGHPSPHVSTNAGRIHHVGKPSIGNTEGKKSNSNTKGAITPTTTNFMPNIALGSINNDDLIKRKFESNPNSRHNIMANNDPLHDFLNSPDPLSKLINAHDTRHKQFSAQDLKISARDLDNFGGSFIKSGPSNLKGFGIVNPFNAGGDRGKNIGNSGHGNHTPRAGSTYSTGSGIDGGLGVAAPGVSRGWCDTCGQGWVGTGYGAQKSCRCGGELDSKIKLTV
ncbi:hypothetical protein FRC16_010773 [Serendipita sp. 398]|nr:hypothetical protein FRC16_010773 [Serendipita sp. 398]